MTLNYLNDIIGKPRNGFLVQKKNIDIQIRKEEEKKMVTEQQEQAEVKQREPTKRGWILGISIVSELVIGILPWFFAWWIGLVGTVIAITVLPFCLIYFWWARRNLFFTFVPEGRAKIVVRGDQFDKVLMQWEGYVFDDDGNVVPTNKWVKKGEVLDVVEVLDRENGEVKIKRRRKPITGAKIYPSKKKKCLGGLRFYGLWPLEDIYLYDFAWTNVLQDGTVQKHPKQTIDYVLLKVDVYWARVQKAEDSQMLPLDVELVLTIRVVNPYKTLFRVQNWLETVINRTEPAVRDVITEDTYEKWISEKEDLADRIISDKETQELLKELRSSFGVEVMAIEVRSINPTTAELDEARKATLKKYFAEKERDRITVEADAERRRLKAVYKTIQQFGDLGKLVRVLEALEKSPGAGAKWVILPGLTDIISQVFPGRGSSSLTSDEARQIRELLEQFRKSNQKREAS